MLLSDLIGSVRMRINDTDEVGFRDEEILDYLNNGIQWLYRLISKHRPELVAVEEYLIEAPLKLGKKPLRVLEGPSDLLVRLDGSVKTSEGVPVYVRYVPDMDLIRNSEELPFPVAFSSFVIEYGAMRAQIRNEFDMGVEADILMRLEAQVLEVIWGMQEEPVGVDPYYPVRSGGSDYGNFK